MFAVLFPCVVQNRDNQHLCRSSQQPAASIPQPPAVATAMAILNTRNYGPVVESYLRCFVPLPVPIYLVDVVKYTVDRQTLMVVAFLSQASVHTSSLSIEIFRCTLFFLAAHLCSRLPGFFSQLFVLHQQGALTLLFSLVSLAWGYWPIRITHAPPPNAGRPIFVHAHPLSRLSIRTAACCYLYILY